MFYRDCRIQGSPSACGDREWFCNAFCKTRVIWSFVRLFCTFGEKAIESHFIFIQKLIHRDNYCRNPEPMGGGRVIGDSPSNCIDNVFYPNLESCTGKETRAWQRSSSVLIRENNGLLYLFGWHPPHQVQIKIREDR